MKMHIQNLDEIIRRNNLIRLAEQAGTTLHKSGNQYRGPCPLHGGDNPTAFVIYDDPDHPRWRCFTGCSNPDRGDALDFVQKWRGMGFDEAVRELARTAGIPLDGQELTAEEAVRLTEQRRRRQQRYDLLEMSAGYYKGRIWNEAGARALAYARRRGFTDETIMKLGLGYADGKLHYYLKSEGADLELAEQVGLIYRGDDGALRDAIPRGYLVYVFWRSDRVEYMSGRAVFTDDKARKSRNLRAPKQLYWLVRRYDALLLVVEGPADAITAWQLGYNAVALCGTSLKDQDAALIQRFKAVHLALDSDTTGLEKVGAIADKLGPLTMIVPPLPGKSDANPDGDNNGDEKPERPRYKDLNEWLVRGKATSDKLAALLGEAKPWLNKAIEQAAIAPIYELDDHLDRLAMLVAHLPSSMRGKYVQEICRKRRLAALEDFRHLLDEHLGNDTCSGNGFEPVDGRMAYYGEPLCNFVAQITHELVQDDGMNTPTVLYTVAGQLDNGEALEPIQIKAGDFDRMNWLSRHWGARPIVYTSPGRTWLLRRAIQEHSRASLVRERVYTFTGWTQVDGKAVYLTTSGALGAEGLNPDVRVDLGINNMRHYALPAPPADPRPAIEASLDFLALAPHEVTVPLWVAMYAAPLHPFRSLNTLLWLYGVTQSGKSTIAHLALTHFGPGFIQGHAYRAPKDWTSTVTDLEGALFKAKDIPIILDDFAPVQTSAAEARSLRAKAHYIIRSVGNRSSRGRANADLSERMQRPPRGLVIATAEQPIVGHSDVGRMIYVPVEYGQIITAAGDGMPTDLDRAQTQAQDGLYAQAMAVYIAWLASKWEYLEAMFLEQLEEETRRGRILFSVNQSRLVDYYALLTVADRLALTCFAEVGALSTNDVENLTEVHRLTLVQLLQGQGERIAAQSPVLKFWQAMEDLLIQEKIYLAPKGHVPDFIPPAQGELVGWYERERPRVYLLTNVCLTHVKSYWHSLDERFDTLADALRREMWQQGYVAERGDGRHLEKKCYISQKVGRPRVLVIDAEQVKQKTSIVLVNNVAADESLPDKED